MRSHARQHIFGKTGSAHRHLSYYVYRRLSRPSLVRIATSWRRTGPGGHHYGGDIELRYLMMASIFHQGLSSQQKAYVLALLTVLLWSTVASAFKLSLRHMDPLQLLFYSSLFSACALAILLVFQGKLARLQALSRKDSLYAAALGLLSPFLYYLILFRAYDLLPAQEAQPLNYTWAFTLTFLSVPLLKQHLGRGDILAGFISYSGVLVICTRGQLASMTISHPVGAMLALGSTLIWALFWIYKTRSKVDPVVGLFLSFLFSLPFSAIACGLFSDFRVADLRGILGAAYVGCFEMGFAFVLWLSALRLAENTSRISYLIFLSPFLSLVFIHLLVGEVILPSTLLGLPLIICGLVVQQFGRFNTKPA